MKACKELCPVHHISRCCFLCDEQKTCQESCQEESNNLCELLVDMPDDAEELAKPILERLASVTSQIEALEEKEKGLKESLKALMEQFGVKALDKNPYFKVTYIAATTSTSFDSNLFKKSYPELYGKFTKTSDKKAYIKCEAPKKKG